MKLQLLKTARARSFCILAAIVLFQLTAQLLAQPAIHCNRTFGGNRADISASVKPTSDCGYITGGSFTSPASDDKTQDGPTVNNQPGYCDIDVTDFVQSQMASDKIVSLVLKNPTDVNKKLVFHSKENPSGMAPQLVVTSNWLVISNARESKEFVSADKLLQSDHGSLIFPNPVK